LRIPKSKHSIGQPIGGIGLLHKYIPTILLSTDFQTGSSFLKKPSLSAPTVLFAPQSLDAKGNDFVVAEIYAVYLKINNIKSSLIQELVLIILENRKEVVKI
jgi:hypothetical protein